MIKLENVHKKYKLGDEEIVALNCINLHIKSGEFVTILGKSGSGKSTLLNIMGMLDNYEGTYILDNENVSKLKSNQLAKIRNKKIGFIYQSFNLLPKLSAVENVALPLMYNKYSNKESIEKAKEYLKIVGLEDKINNKPKQLSGGQQQRVAIARALVNNPKIIFADEPTGALDSKTSRDIMDLLKKISKEEKITIIMVTHDESLAKETNRIIRVVDGKIVE